MTTELNRLLAGLPPEGLQLYSPVSLLEHPIGGRAIDEAAVAWVVEQGLCAADASMTKMDIGSFVAYGMPFLTEDAVIPKACYTYWAFAWDDHLDTLAGDLPRAAALTGEANRVLYEPADAPLPDDVLLTSTRDLRCLLETSLSPQGVAAVRGETSHWLNSQLWKLALQARATPPSVGEYLRMRWPKCGAGVLAAYTAPGGGYTMTPGELHDPLVRAFSMAVFYPCTIINDLGSLAKETQAGTSDINLITVLGAEQGLDTAGALFKAAELYERILCLMPRLQQQLLADPRPAVARYAAELPQWIPATVQYTATSARYLATGTDSPLTVTPSPAPLLWDPDDLTPPPYPDLAWWWELLA